MSNESPRFSAYYALPVEGARIGLVTCLQCGVVVILNEDNYPALHDQWHDDGGEVKG